MHTYRNKTNRHGHSNDKPSFFAMGYQSFEEFEQSVSVDDLKEYLQIHTKCCVPFAKI